MAKPIIVNAAGKKDNSRKNHRARELWIERKRAGRVRQQYEVGLVGRPDGWIKLLPPASA